MELESAIRATEILLGFAFALSSAEHLYTAQKDRILPLIKLMASALLCFGVLAPYMCLLLCLLTLRSLYHYQGPYNGGSDRMGALILFCLTLANLLPQQQYQELAFGYLAIQLMLSYFMAGYVKIINPDWRNGQALQDVFSFSAYPAYANLHALAPKTFICSILVRYFI